MPSSVSLVSDSYTGRTVWLKGCHSSCVLKRIWNWDSFWMMILQLRTQRKALPSDEASHSWLACCWSTQMDFLSSYLHWSPWLPCVAIWHARQDPSRDGRSALSHRCMIVHSDSSLTYVSDQRRGSNQLWIQLCLIEWAVTRGLNQLIECGRTRIATSALSSDSISSSYGLSAWIARLHGSFLLVARWHSSMIAFPRTR